jgi:hypothetical protein
MNAYELTKALGGTWNGREGSARCAAHKDRNPSLSIGTGEDGKTPVFCHANCSQDAVIEALKARGLWENGASHNFTPKSNGHGNGKAAEWKREPLDVAQTERAARDATPHGYHRNGLWWYLNTAGDCILIATARYDADSVGDNGKRRKTYPPFIAINGNVICGFPPKR